MFCKEVSVVANALPKDVWALWSDVGSWSKWDPDVRYCQLKQGSFQKGAKATLKPRSGPKVNIEIIECVAGQKFTSHSFLPLTTIVFHHEVKPQGQGQSLITHRVEFNGLLAPMFYCIVGRGIAKGLPIALQNLARLAEKH